MTNENVFMPAIVGKVAVSELESRQVLVAEIKEPRYGLDDNTEKFEMIVDYEEIFPSPLVAVELPLGCQLTENDKVAVLPIPIIAPLFEIPNIQVDAIVSSILSSAQANAPDEEEAFTNELLLQIDEEDKEGPQIEIENFNVAYTEIVAINNIKKCPNCPVKAGCVKNLVYEIMSRQQEVDKDKSNIPNKPNNDFNN